MNIIFYALSFIFIICTLLIAVGYARKTNKMDLLFWFLIGVCSLYGVVFLLNVYLGTSVDGFVSNRLLSRNFDVLVYLKLLHFILIFSVVIGWCVARSNKACEFTLQDHNSFVYYTKAQRAAWFILLLGMLIQVLVTSKRGGYVNQILYSRALGGIADLEVADSILTIFSPFLLLPVLSFILFFSLAFKLRKVNVLLGLLISFFVASYSLVAFSGRLTIVVYILSPLVGYVVYKRVRPSLVAIVVPVSIFIPLMLIGFISRVFDWKYRGGFVELILIETSFPIVSFVKNYLYGNVGSRFFVDIIDFFQRALPGFLRPFDIESIAELNTSVFHEVSLVDAVARTGGLGQVPVDFITLGYWNGGILGVFLFGFIYGFLMRKLNSMVCRIRVEVVRDFLMGVIVVRVIFGGLYYMDPSNFVNKNIMLLVVVLGLSLYMRGAVSRPKSNIS